MLMRTRVWKKTYTLVPERKSNDRLKLAPGV